MDARNMSVGVFVLVGGVLVASWPNLALADFDGRGGCACITDLTGQGIAQFCNADPGGVVCTTRDDCPDGQECVSCYVGPDGQTNFTDILYQALQIQGGVYQCGAGDPDVNCDGFVDYNDLAAVVAGSQTIPDSCNQPRGACCTPDGPCVVTSQLACENNMTQLGNGTYLGDGTTCDPGPCDCDGDGVLGGCEVDCTLPGCNVPGCGGSEDCNGNNQPDECELGACCLTTDTGEPLCAVDTLPGCQAGGGTWRGPCAECPEQNAAIIDEGDGTVFVHQIGPPSECPPAGRASRPDKGGCGPGPFTDPWESGVGDPGAPATMCHSFGVAGSPPIPADFFGPGSDPFTGTICLQGVPLGDPNFPGADTLIERATDPFDRCEPPSAAESTVDVEVVALNLASVTPITVTFNGDTSCNSPANCEDWDATVDLSPSGLPPETPQSTLSAIKRHCNGGTYTSELYVQPRFTFTHNTDIAILDTFDETGFDAVQLLQAQPLWWVSDLDPNLGITGDPCSDFHPAVIEVIQQQTECTPPPGCVLETAIPTVSEWGLLVMTLGALSAGTIIFARRRPAAGRR